MTFRRAKRIKTVGTQLPAASCPDQMRFLKETLKLSLPNIVRISGRREGTVRKILYYQRHNHTMRGYRE